MNTKNVVVLFIAMKYKYAVGKNQGGIVDC